MVLGAKGSTSQALYRGSPAPQPPGLCPTAEWGTRIGRLGGWSGLGVASALSEPHI